MTWLAAACAEAGHPHGDPLPWSPWRAVCLCGEITYINGVPGPTPRPFVYYRERGTRRIDTAVAMILSHEAVQGLTTHGPGEDTGGTTTTTVQEDTMSTQTTLTAVNAQPTDARTGHAVLGIVLAQASLREDLTNAVEAFVYDAENGISVLVNSAGARQHLANALALPKETFPLLLAGGFGTARRGEMLGVKVTVWSVSG